MLLSNKLNNDTLYLSNRVGSSKADKKESLIIFSIIDGTRRYSKQGKHKKTKIKNQ